LLYNPEFGFKKYKRRKYNVKKSLGSIAVLTLLAAAGAPGAYAGTTWDLSGTGACGEDFTGTFVTDDSGILTSSNIVGTGGCLSLLSLSQGNQDGDFTNIEPFSSSSFTVADNPFAAGDDNLFLYFVNPLTPAPLGTVDSIIPYDGGGPDGTSFYLDEYGDFVGIVSGEATVAPEPASVLLIAGGLISLLAVGRLFRRNRYGIV
jgi:hypothetical protein